MATLGMSRNLERGLQSSPRVTNIWEFITSSKLKKGFFCQNKRLKPGKDFQILRKRQPYSGHLKNNFYHKLVL